MMGYPGMGCNVLGTYGARHAPPQRGAHSPLPVLAEAPSGGAKAGWTHASPGGEGPRATAVLRDQVRTWRTSHRSRRSATIRKALSQAVIVLLATEGRPLRGPDE